MPEHFGQNTFKLVYLWVGKSLFALILVFGVNRGALAQTPSGLGITTSSWATNLPSLPAGVSLDFSNGSCTTGDVFGNSANAIICLNETYNPSSSYFTHSIAPLNQTPSSTIILENATANPSGFNETIAIGTISANTSSSITSSANNLLSTCAVADFDGDGKSDLACFPSTITGSLSLSPTIWFSYSGVFSNSFSATGALPFEQVVTAGPGNGNSSVAYLNSPTGRTFGSSCTVGHFMAGAGQNILCALPESGGVPATNNYYIWRFNASFPPGQPEGVTDNQYIWTGPTHITTSFTSQGTTIGDTWSNYADFGSNCLVGDFNGDGLSDVACPDGSGNWNVGLSNGTGFTDSLWSTGDTYHPDCATGDFNGDGKTDIICYVDGATTPLRVYLSTGSGFQSYQTWAFPGMPPAQNPDNTTPRDNSVFSSICSLADLNGDGKMDIICYANNTSSPSQWIYAVSTGSGFTTGTLNFVTPPTAYLGNDGYVSGPQMAFSSNSGCSMADLIGKGLADIYCTTGLSTSPIEVGIISRQ